MNTEEYADQFPENVINARKHQTNTMIAFENPRSLHEVLISGVWYFVLVEKLTRKEFLHRKRNWVLPLVYGDVDGEVKYPGIPPAPKLNCECVRKRKVQYRHFYLAVIL